MTIHSHTALCQRKEILVCKGGLLSPDEMCIANDGYRWISMYINGFPQITIAIQCRKVSESPYHSN